MRLVAMIEGVAKNTRSLTCAYGYRGPHWTLGSVRHLEYALLMAYVVIRFLISIHIVLSYGAVIPRGNMHSISSMIGRAGDNASDRPCMQFKTSGIVDALLTSRFRLLHFGIQ